jgi:hypothetical protein
MPFGKRAALPGLNAEQRRSPRAPSDAAAHVVLASGKTIPCRIRDLSSTGARLSVESVLGLPAQFEMRVGRHAYRAQITRRGTRLIAVRFH